MPFTTQPAPILTAPLTGNPLDRADALRDKPDALAAALRDPSARLLTLCGGKAPIVPGDAPTLLWTEATPRTLEAAVGPPVFLGLDTVSGAARFAVDLPESDEAEAMGLWPSVPKFVDLRTVGGALPEGEAAIYAGAKSLLAWHASHRFCAKCGAESVPARGGWRRDCPRCDAKHFPRTDPVVIMLVLHRSEEHGERLAIGRQRQWMPGLYSLLAGYVEPGESVEEAVRRETLEESGLTVGRVAVLASQPWPFPSTLMIGCLAEALDDVLTPDLTELEDARWIDRAEMAQVIAGEHPSQIAPRADAIARILVEAWVDGRLSL